EDKAHLSIERMEFHLEMGDDTEIEWTAPKRPEQLGIVRVRHAARFTAGRHEFHRIQLIAAEPVLAHAVAEPAAEQEPCESSLRHEACRCEQSMRLGCGIDVSQERPALDASHPSI